MIPSLPKSPPPSTHPATRMMTGIISHMKKGVKNVQSGYIWIWSTYLSVQASYRKNNSSDFVQEKRVLSHHQQQQQQQQELTMAGMEQ